MSNRITDAEKMKIINLLKRNKSIKEIAKAIGKSEKITGQHIRRLRETVQQAFFSHENNSEVMHVSVFESVVNKFVKDGYDRVKIEGMVNSIAKKLKEKGVKDFSEDEIVSLVNDFITRGETFITTTETKDSRISVMTEAASQIGDATRRGPRNLKESVNNKTIFRI